MSATEAEVSTIQRHLRAAMNALDATDQGDLAAQVKIIFTEVARRAYPDLQIAPRSGE